MFWATFIYTTCDDFDTGAEITFHNTLLALRLNNYSSGFFKLLNSWKRRRCRQRGPVTKVRALRLLEDDIITGNGFDWLRLSVVKTIKYLCKHFYPHNYKIILNNSELKNHGENVGISICCLCTVSGYRSHYYCKYSFDY